MKKETILKNMSLLNMLLTAAAAIFSAYIILPLLNPDVKYPVSPAKRHAEKEAPRPAAPHQFPSPAEYAIVAEQNPFHPDRRMPAQKTDAPPLPRPDFVLYGTLITEGSSLAYLEDLKAPYSTPGRGKRQTALRKGDAMNGFTLKEVEADRVVMARGDEQIVVQLNDPQRVKAREPVQRPPVTFQQLQGQPPQPDQQRPPAQQFPAAQQQGATSPSSQGQTEGPRNVFENIFKPR